MKHIDDSSGYAPRAGDLRQPRPRASCCNRPRQYRILPMQWTRGRTWSMEPQMAYFPRACLNAAVMSPRALRSPADTSSTIQWPRL